VIRMTLKFLEQEKDYLFVRFVLWQFGNGIIISIVGLVSAAVWKCKLESRERGSVKRFKFDLCATIE